jgi:integrase
MNISEDNKLRFFDFKSKDTYSKWISNYKCWLSNQNEQTECADSVLSYIIFLTEDYAASSLWTIYSILNKYFKVYLSTNLKDCTLLQDFLKKQDKQHLVKKSKVLSKDNIANFLNLEDTDTIIVAKVALVIGIHGLLRISEITDLKFDNVEKKDDHYIIFIEKSKTDQAKKGFQFFVQGDHVAVIDKYINLFISEERKGRFFRSISRGKGSRKVCGKNVIGKFPFLIASTLNLNDSKEFTGHCFRRTGATLIADSGVDKITLKRAGRWKSDSVCDGYIEESSSSKLLISKAVCSDNKNVQNVQKNASNLNVYNINGCSGVTLNFYNQ